MKDGRLIRKNMRREYITEEELMAHLRIQGIERLEEVKKAYVESEGEISVIKST